MRSLYARNHGHRVAVIRFAVAAWLTALTVYACAHGLWWALVLLAPAALHVYLGVRALQPPDSR